MTSAGAFAVPPDHPCLPGHFPGQPLVPGVVLLDEAMSAALPPGMGLAGFAFVRFLRPVLPGDEVQVQAGPPGDGRMAFECLVGGAAALRGVALVRLLP